MPADGAQRPRPAPLRPRWMDVADPDERRVAHVVDMLGFCGHYIHFNGGGRSGKAPILCALLMRGGQMPQRELMGIFDLKPGSLSETLAKLEELGLVERTRDAADRRQLIVRLTDEGRRRAEEDQRTRESFRATCLSCLDKDEIEQLEDMLERINRHWRTLDD